MDARLDFFGNALGAKLLKHTNSANKVVAGSGLPAATQELVKIRAGQINGCGFCADMHTEDAAGGVTDEAWADAAEHYDEDRLVASVSLIAVINACNRVNVIDRQPAGATGRLPVLSPSASTTRSGSVVVTGAPSGTVDDQASRSVPATVPQLAGP
ncbi:AhpD family alkylhydroperoxidase OS=Streptomyces griseomycini OX=66895 GN=FHS37_003145 PE=4 SV=1 [Streptomyces griseomycini]|uniref:AhpD family alkylhydroperoxidase n=1 Tax=Streptomyces griseomycini TaxID=66895 RepID=A0A7W7LZ14_9ACTN|nr:AhpD family alkylhydroperoxidase [Streptomyces griseomycini]GGR21428.1 hypothetical protein GCM10015536_28880 [Streptomyces griseomycini]